MFFFDIVFWLVFSVIVFLRFVVETKDVGFKNLPSSDSQNSKGGSDIGMVEATGWMLEMLS